MKKIFTKKLSLNPTTIAKLAQASGGRTLTWTCYSTPIEGCSHYCDPDAPTGTIALTDSCNPEGNCW